MKVVQDNLWFCGDCTIVSTTGDDSSLDYYYQPEEAARVRAAMVAGLTRLGPYVVPDFDSETEMGIRDFSYLHCDCCGTYLAGTRHRFAVLGRDDATAKTDPVTEVDATEKA